MKRSLVHGLDRRTNTQAPVLIKIGEILQNSIKINELNPRAEKIKNSYVLVGAAQNQNGQLYIASFVVNKYSNEITEIDVLYSANAKKESAAFLPKITDKSATPTDSIISISQLLDYVNKYFPDILPEAVLRHYGYDARPDGKIGESALYQDRSPDSFSNRSLLANTLADTIDASTPLTAEKIFALEKLHEYQAAIGKIEALEAHLAEVNAEIKKISFTKSSDRSKLAALKDEKTKTANRINLYNKKLLEIEAMKPIKALLEREKAAAFKRAEQKGKATLAAYREYAEQNQRDLMDYYREVRKRGVENRTKTEMWRNIIKGGSEFNQYLLNGTKDKKKIRDTANRINGLGRPVGYALENDISNKSISQNGEVVNTQNAL